MSIVAPVTTAQQARAAIEAGADEVYCGAMFDEWAAEYGEADLLSRRQGRLANVGNRAELGAIAQTARDLGRTAHLALNVRYSAGQRHAVLDLASLWRDSGGTGVLACDIGLLLGLRQRGLGLRAHLSILAGAFNSAAVRLFTQLGIVRAVLPRAMRLDEVQAITAALPKVEFEMLAMNQKCEFIDAFCGFAHCPHYPAGHAAQFTYERNGAGGPAVAWAHDLAYEGHGCQLAYLADGRPVKHIERDDADRPHCAACSLGHLRSAGVRFLKIAGRGFPTELIVRSVRFLRQALEIAGDGPSLRALYASTFGHACGPDRCYYRFGLQGGG